MGGQREGPPQEATVTKLNLPGFALGLRDLPALSRAFFNSLHTQGRKPTSFSHSTCECLRDKQKNLKWIMRSSFQLDTPSNEDKAGMKC